MKNPIKLAALLILGLVSGACTSGPRFQYLTDQGQQDLHTHVAARFPAARFAVFSDPHLYDNSLGIHGEAFQNYLKHDRKLLVESERILGALTEQIEALDVDFVLIPGDLTKDGEKACHDKMAARLGQLEAAGIQVWVVPGNHDVLNPDAVSFFSDTVQKVKYYGPEEFASAYADFGYAQALARDPESLSYVAEPAPGLRLLAIDSCNYKNNEKNGHPYTGGIISQNRLDWIESQLIAAHRDGKAVIAMMHHGILQHYGTQKQYFGEYVVDDYQSISRMLAHYNVKVVFTGHYHAQDITKADFGSGKFLFDIETGSMVTYPCPFRELTIGENQMMSVRTHHVTAIEGYALGFAEYSRQFVYDGIAGIARDTLKKYGLDAGEIETLVPQISRAFLAHYAGDEIPPADGNLIKTEGLSLMGSLVVGNQKGLVEGLWDDLPPKDNNLTINLADGSWE